MFKCLNDKMLKCKGFTLVELLASIFIIILMAGIIFANYRQGGQQFALQRSANKLAQDMRRIEEMVMSAKEFGGSIPQGGYGIYLSSTNPYSYIIFADSNENYSYDAGDKLVENPNFEPGVKINFLALHAPREFFAVSNSTLILTPPDPKVTIYQYPLAQSAYAVLTINGQTKVVSINLAGLVEIDPVLPPCVCELWGSYQNQTCEGDPLSCGEKGCSPDKMTQERCRECYDVQTDGCSSGWATSETRCLDDWYVWGDWEEIGLGRCCLTGGIYTQHKRVGTPHYGCKSCQGIIDSGDCPSPPGDSCVAEAGECVVECRALPSKWGTCIL